MAGLIACKECGHNVATSAKTCPNCGVKKPAKKPSAPKPELTPRENLVALIIVLVIGGGLYFWVRDTPEERAAEAARTHQEKAAKQKAGFHCLSDWDGSHRAVVRFAQQRLRDPDSFDHVETRITSVDASGEHQLVMRYRAKNAFGGVTLGFVAATIENQGCKATITSIE